jgi:hypothetical protein
MRSPNGFGLKPPIAWVNKRLDRCGMRYLCNQGEFQVCNCPDTALLLLLLLLLLQL